MKFDVVMTNPPFQDTLNRKKTPHKLWIDFTLSIFDRLLVDGGSLLQVSPASFASPSNVVLDLMTRNQTHILRLDTQHHFPDVASTFSDYWIEKSLNDDRPTIVRAAGEEFSLELDSAVAYLPNDLCRISLAIHGKCMFNFSEKLNVEWDYVVAHNIRRYDPVPSLVEERDSLHPHPVFHTNRSTWWSSIRQDWASVPKVMWTRSGYTKPFFDAGQLGGTDMVYYIRVESSREGEVLAGNLNTKLLQYIYKTAKWSGFGNERVFSALPNIPRDVLLSDDEMFAFFGLSQEEVDYVERFMEPRRRKA